MRVPTSPLLTTPSAVPGVVPRDIVTRQQMERLRARDKAAITRMEKGCQSLITAAQRSKRLADRQQSLLVVLDNAGSGSSSSATPPCANGSQDSVPASLASDASDEGEATQDTAQASRTTSREASEDEASDSDSDPLARSWCPELYESTNKVLIMAERVGRLSVKANEVMSELTAGATSSPARAVEVDPTGPVGFGKASFSPTTLPTRRRFSRQGSCAMRRVRSAHAAGTAQFAPPRPKLGDGGAGPAPGFPTGSPLAVSASQAPPTRPRTGSFHLVNSPTSPPHTHHVRKGVPAAPSRTRTKTCGSPTTTLPVSRSRRNSMYGGTQPVKRMSVPSFATSPSAMLRTHSNPPKAHVPPPQLQAQPTSPLFNIRPSVATHIASLSPSVSRSGRWSLSAPRT